MNINKRIIEDDNDLRQPRRKLLPFPKSINNNEFILEQTNKLNENQIQNKNISSFFTQTIINNYNLLVSSSLKILNFEQTLRNMNKLNNTRDYENILLLQRSLPNMCVNIASKYANECVERGTKISEYIDYDICMLVAPNETNINLFIKGFLIVQRNECPKYPNVYCLKLICAQEQGHLLVGCYLYTILNHPKLETNRIKLTNIVYPINNNSNEDIDYYGTPIEHIALLEISGSYKNINALCLYSKFGFKADITLRGFYSNCFIEENNLPMIINFDKDELTQDKLIKIIKKEDEGFKKHIICQITDKKLQKLLSYLYLIRDKRFNELTKVEEQAKEDIQRRINNLNRDINYIENNKNNSIDMMPELLDTFNNLEKVFKGGIKNRKK